MKQKILSIVRRCHVSEQVTQLVLKKKKKTVYKEKNWQKIVALEELLFICRCQMNLLTVVRWMSSCVQSTDDCPSNLQDRQKKNIRFCWKCDPYKRTLPRITNNFIHWFAFSPMEIRQSFTGQMSVENLKKVNSFLRFHWQMIDRIQRLDQRTTKWSVRHEEKLWKDVATHQQLVSSEEFARCVEG